MPELPEVETIRRKLIEGREYLPSILGKTIKDVKVFWGRTVEVPSVRSFEDQIKNQVIANIGRRGKYFIFSLTDHFLLIHLRMSGDLQVTQQDKEINPHTRVVINFLDDWRL